MSDFQTHGRLAAAPVIGEESKKDGSRNVLFTIYKSNGGANRKDHRQSLKMYVAKGDGRLAIFENLQKGDMITWAEGYIDSEKYPNKETGEIVYKDNVMNVTHIEFEERAIRDGRRIIAQNRAAEKAKGEAQNA